MESWWSNGRTFGGLSICPSLLWNSDRKLANQYLLWSIWQEMWYLFRVIFSVTFVICHLSNRKQLQLRRKNVLEKTKKILKQGHGNQTGPWSSAHNYLPIKGVGSELWTKNIYKIFLTILIMKQIQFFNFLLLRYVRNR